MAKSRRLRVDKKAAIDTNNKINTNITVIVEGIISAIRTTPLGVMFIAGIAFFQLEALPMPLVSAVPVISYVTLIFGMAITSCFNRSRTFFVLLTLFLSELGMAAYTPAHIDRSFAVHGIYSAVSLLVPLNFLVFSSMSERGIISYRGKRCLIFILLQVVLVMTMILSGDKELFNDIDKRFIGLFFMPPTPIPDIAVIAFVITGIVLLVKRRKVDAHFKIAIFSALVAIAFAQHYNDMLAATALFYTTAGLIIILSVIQDYYFKAYLDELTGLPSRRSLNEDMLRLDGTYVIAMLDVDFFKKFNDTYGHDAGDDVLRFIARIMKEFKAGKSFRYGGEEFTILFPGKSTDEAIPFLEELREKIAKSKFVVRGGGKKGLDRQLNVTVSIGVAESNKKLINPEAVIKVADTALYQAKENGRNCVSK